MRPGDHPLKQMTMDSSVGKLTNQNKKITKFGYLSDEIVYRINHMSMDQLYAGETEEVQRYLGPHGMDELRKYLSYVPRLDLSIQVMPITRAILKIQLTITPEFDWNDRWNGKNEPFWIIVDNETEILHSEFFLLNK